MRRTTQGRGFGTLAAIQALELRRLELAIADGDVRAEQRSRNRLVLLSEVRAHVPPLGTRERITFDPRTRQAGRAS